jgi:hypothetical protein
VKGSITRRGKHSWRLKFEGGTRDATTGKRTTTYITTHGTKKQAQESVNTSCRSSKPHT